MHWLELNPFDFHQQLISKVTHLYKKNYLIIVILNIEKKKKSIKKEEKDFLWQKNKEIYTFDGRLRSGILGTPGKPMSKLELELGFLMKEITIVNKSMVKFYSKYGRKKSNGTKNWVHNLTIIYKKIL